MNSIISAHATLEAAGITFFERGWLSANNILFQGGEGPSALVDSGYCSHAHQTLSLIKQCLHSQSLDLLLNTHLHSDHCGGNSILQTEYPELTTLIPPGHARAVHDWDTTELSFEATGQDCPRFIHHGLLVPGQSIRLGPMSWEIHAAKGHDPHSIVLFQPEKRILLSADALWENGFGVVFPEIEGFSAFHEVEQTLDVIEKLSPLIVIPGHGRLFTDVQSALLNARSRLKQFVQDPNKHQRYAVKVLIKYKLLEWQEVSYNDLITWIRRTPYLKLLSPQHGVDNKITLEWVNELLFELQKSRALRRENDVIFNT